MTPWLSTDRGQAWPHVGPASDRGRMRHSRYANPVVGVLGGCGGAGATTFSAALAASAARTDQVAVLIDLDAIGGGIDVALGAEDAVGARWSGLHVSGDRLDPAQLAEGLPRWGEALFLACDSPTLPDGDAVWSVISSARELGPVVIDLGRSPTPARTAALAEATAVVLVVLGRIQAVAASAAAVGLIGAEGAFGGEWQLVVRPDEHVVAPGRIAAILELPLAGTLGRDRGLAAARDTGVQIGRVGRQTRRLLDDVLHTADALAGVPAPTGARR